MLLFCNLSKKGRQLTLLAFVLTAASFTQAATIQVTSNSDQLNPGAGCSLRGAVTSINGASAANGCTATGTFGTADTIVFSSALTGNTIAFTALNGEIQIQKTLIIDATDAPGLILNGGGTGSAFRLLNVTTTGTPLTVRKLSFTNAGHFPIAPNVGGGAISSQSNVTAENCVFDNNQATWGNSIYSPLAVTVTVKNSRFSNGLGMFCGAICLTAFGGTVNSEDSVFENNQAANGAAIYARAIGHVNGSSAGACRFSNNSVTGNAGAVYAVNSGAIIENCQFNNNTAGSNGGAAYLNNGGNIINSTFTNNQSGSTWRGGAVFAGAAGTLTVTDSAFSSNQSGNGGGIGSNGGPVVVGGSTFSGNTAATSGGAVSGTTVSIANSTFTTNTATANGGAISAATANVANSTFNTNSATTNGGAISATATANLSASTFSANSAATGGALYAATPKLRHVTMVNNIAATGASIAATGTADIAVSLLASTSTVPHCGGAGSFSNDLQNLVWLSSGDDTSCGTDLITASAVSGITQIVATTLANNGGPTQTLALPSSNSPAFAQATAANSQMLDTTTFAWVTTTADQRGNARPGSGKLNADLGAFELPGQLPPPPPGAQPIPANSFTSLILLMIFMTGIVWGMRRSRP